MPNEERNEGGMLKRTRLMNLLFYFLDNLIEKPTAIIENPHETHKHTINLLPL